MSLSTTSVSGRTCALCARFVLNMPVAYYSPLRYETHVRPVHDLIGPSAGVDVRQVVLR